ncbi:MAG: hypothetical protein JNL50_03650 [Phycisphaerae bacterium]|nr:hypothetical protein [Phycisphaerae bacterium]
MVAEPPRRSPYSARAKIGRVLWSVAAVLVFKASPSGWNGLRRGLLRLFGAKVGAGSAIHPSVHIEIPWNLEIGTNVRVCERAILYCLGPVVIGDGTLVGPFVHLCAGTHDYTNPAFTLVRSSITVGARCALLTASFVAPGVVVADGTVLLARAGLFKNSEADTTYEGNPAKAVVKS